MGGAGHTVGVPKETSRQIFVALEYLATWARCVGILSNMKAEVLARERHVLDEDAFVEIVISRVPRPVKESTHGFKYPVKVH